LIDENYKFEDPGVLVLKTIYGTYQYSNWYFTQYGGKEGLIDLTRAIARSTDTFFYKLGEMLGPEKINLWANRFGLGSTTKIDIPGEVSGLIPSPDWKLKTKNERWFLGNTYHMSIGQGDLAVTPAEMTRGVSVLASGGLLCPLHFVNVQGDCEDTKIGRENINLVKKGMTEVCKTGGTGYTFFDFFEKSGGKTDVACKTGTAEINEDGKTHAWFTAFAPVENPEIVATVLIEEGGEGSKVAGPIARNIFNYWFKIP
jgi:penicillin-binding protein 2